MGSEEIRMRRGGCSLSRLAGISILLCVVVGLNASCGREDEGVPVAKVGNRVITEQDIEKRLESMPPFMRQQLSTPDGKKRFVNALVEEEAIVREARARGLDQTEEFNDEIEMAKRDLLVRLFYSKVIEAASAPSDAEVAAYYEAHLNDYTVPEHVMARHIVVETRREAQALKKEIESGADFGELARERSLDQQTKRREGIFHGRIERGKPISGLGEMPELVEAAFDLDVGELSDPIETELGYHLMRVDERNPAETRSLDTVREDIAAALANAKVEGVRDSLMGYLKNKYKVVYYLESSGQTSPEGLFKLASEESDARRKIQYYRDFIETYPENERAYEAKFMIGFTLAEDLSDYDEAEGVFKEFLEEYPENDLTDDARWMLENMRTGGQPDFTSE
jgi:peptidyl-prolyl cis-trans isomerase C